MMYGMTFVLNLEASGIYLCQEDRSEIDEIGSRLLEHRTRSDRLLLDCYFLCSDDRRHCAMICQNGDSPQQDESVAGSLEQVAHVPFVRSSQVTRNADPGHADPCAVFQVLLWMNGKTG